MHLAALMMLAAAVPGATLTPVQKRTLARALICPERLADDPARIRNTELFFDLYGHFMPGSHAGERMAYRDALLLQKRCKPQNRSLIHTFPEI